MNKYMVIVKGEDPYIFEDMETALFFAAPQGEALIVEALTLFDKTGEEIHDS